jgi:hypothetical protein
VIHRMTACFLIRVICVTSLSVNSKPCHSERSTAEPKNERVSAALYSAVRNPQSAILPLLLSTFYFPISEDAVCDLVMARGAHAPRVLMIAPSRSRTLVALI